jgi:endonuclease/exonuclease/phosphatase family metal-dependent hydrolase
MRFISYNILDGGEGRADPLAEVLEAQRPDIVALIEADVPVVVERIAKRLAMDFVVGEGRNHSVALLSRWPIQQSINHAATDKRLSRCFLEATVLDPAGAEWPIGVLHLPAGATDADEDARVRDLAIILDLLKKYRLTGKPHFLCGDFNANAVYQQIDPEKCRLKTQQAWKTNGQRLPRQAISAVIEAGYTDTYAVRHNELSHMVGSFDTQTPGQRVDYIFASGLPDSAVKDSWVEQDRLAKYASDHFPVGVEIHQQRG